MLILVFSPSSLIEQAFLIDDDPAAQPALVSQDKCFNNDPCLSCLHCKYNRAVVHCRIDSL